MNAGKSNEAKFFEEVLDAELEQIKAGRRLRKESIPVDESQDTATERAEQSHLFGLGFSGGGIRSATFNLGVLQALARAGLLPRFDYLSTNSGGGYIGSWFSAWVKNKSFEEVNDTLGRKPDSSRSSVEPPTIRHLREFSNFLTPKVGLFTADTWTVIATYARNMLLNLTILVAVLSVILLVPRILGVSAGYLKAYPLATLATGAFLIVLGLIVIGFNVATLYGRKRHWFTSQGVVQLTVVVPLFLGAMMASLGIWYSHVTKWAWFKGATTPDTWVASELQSWIGADAWLWGAVAAAVYSLAWSLIRLCTFPFRRRADPNRPLSWNPLVFSAPVAGFVGGVATWAVLKLAIAVFGGAGADWSIVPSPLVPAPAVPVPDWRVLYITVWGAPLICAVFGLVGIVHLGLIGRNFGEYQRQWWSRLGAWLLIYSVVWLVLSSISLYGPVLIVLSSSLVAAGLSIGWVVTTLSGVLLGKSQVPQEKSGTGRKLVIAIAPTVFIVGLLLIISLGIHAILDKRHPPEFAEKARICTEFWADEDTRKNARSDKRLTRLEIIYTCHSMRLWAAPPLWLLAYLLGLAAIALGLSWRVDINAFSMHLFYRSRLIRAYLGASNESRARQRFTGFDAGDDIQLAGLCPAPSKSVRPIGSEPYAGPYPIINTALNLVGGEKLAWQERKAASFVFTPLYSGYELTDGIDRQPQNETPLAEANDAGKDDGDPKSAQTKNSAPEPVAAYRPTHAYNSGEIRLGTAMAISGAAASPNMGFRSTPALSFLLTVFNVRLGWWLGNPAHKKTGTYISPLMGLKPLVAELFGLTNSRSKYVYLSDGGHFENLGLYELVRRRCRFIIQTDAGADPNLVFEDMGNAIRKCRTDLGVEIDLDLSQLRCEPGSRYSASHCVVGNIIYDKHDPTAMRGKILYIKSSLTGDEPEDVQNYAAENAAFPHETTADQFFSESQFESYRSLGEHIATGALQATGQDTFDGVSTERLFVELRHSWYPPSKAIDESFTRYTETLDTLFKRMNDDNDLKFLDKQIYPEWDELMKDSSFHPPSDEQALPGDSSERRSGFYYCNSLIQLMENVYVGLKLEQESGHPDNRGWMNLFKHWSWSAMFRATWAISAATYGVRFQSFCQRKFGLELGSVKIKSESIGTGCLTSGGLKELSANMPLNSLETRFVREFIEKSCSSESDLKIDSVHGLKLVVEDEYSDEADPKPILEFGFGFALTAGDSICYFRVQDHLRKMGLARAALKEMVGQYPNFARLTPEQFPDDARAWPGELQISFFARLMDSVLREQMR